MGIETLPQINFLSGDAEHEEFRGMRGTRVAIYPLGFPTFLRYRDVERLLRDRRLRNYGLDMLTMQQITSGPLRELFTLLMFNNEGDVHRRLRALVHGAFTPRQVDRIRRGIAELASARLGAVADRGGGDLVSELARPLAITALCDLLGVPRSDIPLFEEWAGALGLAFGLMTAEQVKAAEGAVEPLMSYVEGLISQRRRDARDDLVTALVHAEAEGDRLSTRELKAMIANLLFGGYDTTYRQIGLACLTLLSHPDELVRVGADPTLVASAAEETTRFQPIVRIALRVALEDIDLDGFAIKEGDYAAVAVISANRDPEIFSDPDRFDVGRSGPEVLSFGMGTHFCLGAALARLVLQETIRAFAGMRFVLVKSPSEIEWYEPTEAFRGVKALEVVS